MASTPVRSLEDCLGGTAHVGILTVLATALVGGVICADVLSFVRGVGATLSVSI